MQACRHHKNSFVKLTNHSESPSPPKNKIKKKSNNVFLRQESKLHEASSLLIIVLEQSVTKVWLQEKDLQPRKLKKK